MKIEIVLGNIVKQPDIEALVTSANANLRLGSGVAGAIHMAAGPKLEEYCKPFAPLAVGAGLITPGFKLPNPWIIHVRLAHGMHKEAPEKPLQTALVSMLRLANDNDIRSLALPALGAGMFKLPPMLAARTICQVLERADEWAPFLQKVRICLTEVDKVKLFESANAEVQAITME